MIWLRKRLRAPFYQALVLNTFIYQLVPIFSKSRKVGWFWGFIQIHRITLIKQNNFKFSFINKMNQMSAIQQNPYTSDIPTLRPSENERSHLNRSTYHQSIQMENVDEVLRIGVEELSQSQDMVSINGKLESRIGSNQPNNHLLHHGSPNVTVPMREHSISEHNSQDQGVFDTLLTKFVVQDSVEAPWTDSDFNPFEKLNFPLKLTKEEIFLDFKREIANNFNQQNEIELEFKRKQHA